MAILVSLLAFVLLAFAGCDEDEAPGPPPAVAPAPMELEVLVYNIEYSGGPETDRVIRELDADIVGVLESYARLPEIAQKTGYPYYNTSLQMLSKHPILEPSGSDGLYALIEVKPGYVIPFFNVHLDYVEWGPRALENGDSVKSVIANENEVRTATLEKPMDAMSRLLDEDYPVFLTGDFNQPSSLDGRVPWPVSERLAELGFRDTYRETHPDPAKDAGITQESSGERIDYVYAAGPAKTLDSKLVGEPGGEDVEIEMAPWTSDHRAVLSTFEVASVAMPELVAVDEALRTVGDELVITHNSPGAAEGELAVVTEGDAATDAVETVPLADERGTTQLDTAGWEAGGYDIALLEGDGSEIARTPFYLRDPDANLELSTDKENYAPGDSIDVSWSAGPANRWDWLGVYEASASNPDSDDYLIWDYAEGHDAGTVPPRADGEATLGPESQGKPWPLPPGRYVLHYLLADQYKSAASVEFSVSRP